ncbi:mechanosensitive ion channel family protein [Oceanicola sp. 22II-s10i]|uniref:mechanosensitive ion channel family protein n=1 Tax=Oceanicola sp. 22II-s10i TaxID=1317116 RepID=UPI001C3E2C2A|nr:mechanosensitive ion channel domain-containing protein [Oceanicola sp. 22II-s10i]
MQWFEADTLNPGLPDPPSDVLRDTPQATMESFLALSRDGRYEDAAHLLDLTGVPEAEQVERGASLARMLETIIDRRVVVDWHSLPDVPDAVDATPSSNDPFAAQPRRSLRLWLVDLDNRPVSIRLNRIAPEGAEPVWVFARQSVQNLPALFAIYGPSEFEEALPDVLRTDALWGLMTWELIGLPLLVIGALALGLLMRRYIMRLADSRESELSRLVIRSLCTPLLFFVITFVVGTVTTNVFVFSGRISAVLSPLVIIGYVLAVMILLMNVVDAVLDQLVVKQDEDLSAKEQEARRGFATQVTAWRRALMVIVFLAGAGFVLTSANVFRTLGFSLIGAAGIATVVLGFAGRDILSNILSSMQIALNQSARIGDTILYKDYFCVVERINFTYVQLRVWDRTRLMVPVREFVAEPFENWTAMTPELHRVIKLRLGHGADVERLREAFYGIAVDLDEGDMTEDTDALAVRVADQDTLGIEVWFILPCNDANSAWTYTCRVREALIAEIARWDAEEDGGRYLPEIAASEAA